jgi:hypothetical protein
VVNICGGEFRKTYQSTRNGANTYIYPSVYTRAQRKVYEREIKERGDFYTISNVGTSFFRSPLSEGMQASFGS